MSVAFRSVVGVDFSGAKLAGRAAISVPPAADGPAGARRILPGVGAQGARPAAPELQANGPLYRVRLRTRRAILAGLASLMTIDPPHRWAIMRNGGGDALDAVIAAVGAWRAWRQTDHAAVARHPRYRREGKMYV
jgi:hypothetical protein